MTGVVRASTTDLRVHTHGHGRRAPRAFSIVDLLVSISIIALLLALLMPSIAGVRETARKVVCASNTRQLGIGLMMYADGHRDHLPPSIFAPKFAGDPNANPAMMMTVRVDDSPYPWDGLGWLYADDYLNAPPAFYCPSHFGDNPYVRLADRWSQRQPGIVANYQFRGADAQGRTQIPKMRANMALVTDGLQTQRDFSHKVGSNVLALDMSVVWMQDYDGTLLRSLAVSSDENAQAMDEKVKSAWDSMDEKLSLMPLPPP